MTVKKKVVQSSNDKGGVQKRKKSDSLYNAIMNLFNDNGSTVTFNMEDGSRTISPINKEFLYTDKGRKKSFSDIRSDLFALQNDRNAINFVV